ncbi:DUF2092 domain-containing protein [Sphaerisporangium sp. NPDC088356]|uniref:LolA family protein n=1 Tax=Sphaerisporangium sp. NPDC088356 TaxID=3154871 RepID=UPI00343118AA
MRWGVPVAAIAVVGAAIGAAPVIAAVQGDPSLPDRTAGQLLAEVAKTARQQAPPAMSGTVVETASLGLPALPLPGGSSSSPMSLLSGSHTLKVWYGGDGRLRLALPGPMSETDVIRTGSGEAWVWQSDMNTATRYKVPQGTRAGSADGAEAAHSAMPTATTPAEVAAQVLKAADASTAITVENGQHVAGRAAYQLVLTPKDTSSLVKQVKLALDGENYIPLRVQVFSKGASEPAFEVGFTQVSFSAPAPENFAFTPPAGAKVEEKTLGAEGAPSAEKGMEAGGQAPGKGAKGVRTIGAGWTTVAEVPFSLADLRKPATGGRGKWDNGDPTKVVDSLLKSAKQVSGPWGSGRVIQSKLVSALITDDGRLLVGAVTPEALAEAAGRK